ncbi:F-box/FBD/LRR-repeat protein At5g53840-like [Carica papaya]|uniref:F-box/FBD/LRR-repeat protein At5g53840-like n=1 Tax=Carica papaya TaxID=3649 RepID=UPI000B8D0EFF|nr:F-box/FBD/LRR-repeat protein At5g53840-like [Carica papaya]
MCETKKTGVDHISELPDHLLHRIVCKLPLEEAARTTVLGKPWRSSWHSFLISDFDGEPFFGINSYTDPVFPFVNKHLQTLCNQQRFCLQIFKLCVKYYHSQLLDYLDDLVNLASAHNVNHLHLTLPIHDLLSVSILGIYAHSLQVLKLSGGQLREPEHYSIDSLKFPLLETAPPPGNRFT